MNRRTFLKSLSAAILQGTVLSIPVTAISGTEFTQNAISDTEVKDYLVKMRFYDLFHNDDIYLKGNDLKLLSSTVARLKRVQGVIGHGNFHILGFDDMIKAAKAYSKIGQFTDQELSFLEKIFYRDASQYGFLGKKPSKNITDTINQAKVVKVKSTGHYLYNNDSLETFQKVKKDLGEEVILTSGLRGIPKQFLLFLDKAMRNDGNLSLASRSLAPPGYSFHSAGDFDVGQVNLGGKNFSEDFTRSDVYKKLLDHGYANLRYEKDNLLGVRFEPWHIKLG